MSAELSQTAMVLAAGLGVRMRPLTLERPKPLIEVGGRSMLDQALDRIEAQGLLRAVVNTHYMGDKIAQHLAARTKPEIVFSSEDAPLETGGGVRKALAHFGGKPFFVMAADLPLRDGPVPALERMAAFFDPALMDILLLVMPREKARGFGAGRGDFFLEKDGRLWRKNASADKPFVFISVMIVRSECYAPFKDGAVFSNNLLFDAAEKAGRLYGLIHDGSCYHVGTPQDLAQAQELLQSGRGWG